MESGSMTLTLAIIPPTLTGKPGLVTALAAPFHDARINLVKPVYRRTFNAQPTGGGRVTELTAKPLLGMFSLSFLSSNSRWVGNTLFGAVSLSSCLCRWVWCRSRTDDRCGAFLWCRDYRAG